MTGRGMLRRGLLLLAAPLLALAVALVISSIALLLSHHSPLSTYSKMVSYGVCSKAFPDAPCTAESMVSILDRAVPYFLSALAVAIGFRMALFNIGVGGQYHMAAVLAAGLGAAVSLPAPLHVAFILAVAVVTGAMWAGIAGLLKVTRGVSEVISTIMLNFIGGGLSTYLLVTFFKAGGSDNLSGASKTLPTSAWFPSLNPLLKALGLTAGDTDLYGFAIVAIVVGIGYSILLQRTRFGFDLRASGVNPWAAQASGVAQKGMVVKTMLISGAIAGLVGMPHLLGFAHKYSNDFPAGLGFTGITVALLGRNRPIGMVLGAILIGFLERSAQVLDLNGIPKEIVVIMQGTIVLSVVVAYEVVRRAEVAAAERAVRRRLDSDDGPDAGPPPEPQASAAVPV
ncbi:MAG: ABC transporter permease [Frankiaceae bacterium]